MAMIEVTFPRLTSRAGDHPPRKGLATGKNRPRTIHFSDCGPSRKVLGQGFQETARHPRGLECILRVSDKPSTRQSVEYDQPELIPAVRCCGQSHITCLVLEVTPILKASALMFARPTALDLQRR